MIVLCSNDFAWIFWEGPLALTKDVTVFDSMEAIVYIATSDLEI